jgi:hypothetical protein
MPRGKGIYDDEGTDETKGDRSGPTDQDSDGGTSTREVTPDVADDKETQEPPD